MIQHTREISTETGQGIPPYVPFSTFRNFLDKISKRVPSEIDQDVMPRTSRAIRFQLAAALRYLGLVGRGGSRTDTLLTLAKAQGPERKKTLGEVLRAAYPYLFADLDLASCTTGQLAQEFRRRGASGDTVRKCVAFFVAACKEAGVDVSPHIKPFWGSAPGRQRSANSLESGGPHIEGASAGRHDREDTSSAGTSAFNWRLSLLHKFPDFDPAWGDETKSKWFDDFRKLMELLSEEKHRA